MNQSAAATGRRDRMVQGALRHLLRGSLRHRLSHPPLPTAVGARRLLYAGVLVSSLSLFGAGLAIASGSPQQRALQIVVQVAESLAARLPAVAEDGCVYQAPILPFPAVGDDGFVPSDVGLANLECDPR